MTTLAARLLRELAASLDPAPCPAAVILVRRRVERINAFRGGL